MQFSNRRASRRELSDINVTSLVDIIFNLLLFFMLTTSFSETTGLEIQLPTASENELKGTENDLTITLSEQGEIIVDGVVISASEIEPLLQNHKKAHPKGIVLIQADTAVPHGKVVEVVDAAKRIGLPRLGIATTAE